MERLAPRYDEFLRFVREYVEKYWDKSAFKPELFLLEGNKEHETVLCKRSSDRSSYFYMIKPRISQNKRNVCLYAVGVISCFLLYNVCVVERLFEQQLILAFEVYKYQNKAHTRTK
jgi:hypothetical protein